ncbi:hypothetical protein SAMN05216411_10994 [Nitrosospira multiformis]|nr:hypothetical protein SAMN05216411_10994 [Nitrosospira multiformis]
MLKGEWEFLMGLRKRSAYMNVLSRYTAILHTVMQRDKNVAET